MFAKTALPQCGGSAEATWDARSSGRWTTSTDGGRNSRDQSAARISQTTTAPNRLLCSIESRPTTARLRRTVLHIRCTLSSTFPTGTASVWWTAAPRALSRPCSRPCAVKSLWSEFDPSLQIPHSILTINILHFWPYAASDPAGWNLMAFSAHFGYNVPLINHNL